MHGSSLSNPTQLIVELEGKTKNLGITKMLLPIYISGCKDETLLCESMESMLETVVGNINAGYDIDIAVVTQHIQDGMTIETFNLLVQSLNKELSGQFQKSGGSHWTVTDHSNSTVH